MVVHSVQQRLNTGGLYVIFSCFNGFTSAIPTHTVIYVVFILEDNLTCSSFVHLHTGEPEQLICPPTIWIRSTVGLLLLDSCAL